MASHAFAADLSSGSDRTACRAERRGRAREARIIYCLGREGRGSRLADRESLGRPGGGGALPPARNGADDAREGGAGVLLRFAAGSAPGPQEVCGWAGRRRRGAGERLRGRQARRTRRAMHDGSHPQGGGFGSHEFHHWLHLRRRRSSELPTACTMKHNWRQAPRCPGG